MELRHESVLFGTVAALGLSIYLVGVFLFNPVASWGGTGTTEYFEPIRAVGGGLLIAAMAGWTAWRARHHHT